jgi:hypothetical protein
VISGLDSFAKVLKPIVEEYGPKLQAIIQPVADSIGPAFATFFGDLQKAAASPEGQKFMADMGKALKDIGGALVQALPSALKFTEQALKLVAAVSLLAAQAAPSWIHGAQQIMDFGSQVASNLQTAFSSISDGTFWAQVGAKLQNGLNQIGAFFTQWWTERDGWAGRERLEPDPRVLGRADADTPRHRLDGPARWRLRQRLERSCWALPVTVGHS